MERWIIGIGGMKCASTWIYQCLREHPEICMASTKELKFFNRNNDKGIDWYLSNFASCSPDKIKGEFSPDYLYHSFRSSSAERIHSFCPDTKIIVSIRNPINRLVSHYMHTIRSNSIDSHMSINDAIKLDKGLLDWGLYNKYLVPFYQLFGENNIVVVVFEEIKEHPEEVLRNLYSKVGVSSEFNPTVLTKIVSKGIIPRIGWLERFRGNFHDFLNRHDQGKLINIIVGTRLPEIYRKLNSKPIEKPFLTNELRDELVSYYKEDVRNLRKLTGLGLEQWNEFN